MTTRNQLMTGIVTGALVGTALGMLFAPKTGKETRQVLALKTNAMKTKAGDYITTIRNKVKKGEEIENLNGAAHQEEGRI